MTAKTEAIKSVLAKDELDKVTIQADWAAATAEIQKRAAYLVTLETYNVAKKALHDLEGRVEQNADAVDNPATPEQEHKKTVDYIMRKATLPTSDATDALDATTVVVGTVAIAQRHLDVAVARGAALTTALQ